MRFFSKIKHQNLEDEFDQSKCKSLTQSFIEEKFNDAVQEAEKYFLKSYKGTYTDFINEVKSTQKTNVCLFCWDKPTLSGVCLDCQKYDASCLCIPCFLAQHHEQHQSYITNFSSGSCDCGDSAFIIPSGFCPHHPGPDPNPDLTQMTRDTRTKFITVIRAAFTAVFLYSPYNRKSKKERSKLERFKRPKKLIDYIKQFIPYGDGIRRCASYAIVSVAKQYLGRTLEKGDSGLTGDILSLFGLLISDIYFRDRISVICFRDYNRLFNKFATAIFTDNSNCCYGALSQFFSFSYHFFSEHSILYAVNKESFQWPGFLLEYLGQIFFPMEMTDYNYDTIIENGIFDHLTLVYKFLKIVVRFDEQHSNIQSFLDGYSDFLRSHESMIRFTIPLIPQNEYDLGYFSYHITYFLSLINNLFSYKSKFVSPQNTTFSLNKTFENLLDYYDRKDVRIKSILDSTCDCRISTLVMLHTLFFNLLIGQKNPKEELKNLCQKRRYLYDYFCSTVIQLPLRVIATIFTFSKFSKLNTANKLSIKKLLVNSEITFNSMFGFVQFILSICDDKSRVLNSILTTFGVFDDINDFVGKLDDEDYRRQKNLFDMAYLDCSIFLLSLLTDNTVLSFNDINFKRLRVIELLKRKKATASEIEDYVDEKLNNQIFADELVDYIERVTRKKGGSYFRLKSDGDFNPFFPAMFQMDRMVLLSKYTDKLIPLTDGFEDPSREMNLKNCFKTPEFFCLCYRLLSSTESSPIMKQVGLAMCSCFIKNTTQFPAESYKEDNPITISASSLKELISNVKENKDLINSNWLTVNLQLNDNKNSLLKLILMQENLGKLLIESTGLPVEVDQNDMQNKQDEEKERINQRIQANKAKAALLKQRLMKDFMNRRKQFTNLSSADIKLEEKKTEEQQQKKKKDQSSSENNLSIETDESDEDLESSQQVLTDEFNNILCNVCLTSQDDILGVPCLSLPSILYSLINDKVHKLKTPIQNHSLTYMMNICPHYIHYKCFVKMLSEAAKEKPDTKFYHCMMDRGVRNCFLPIFEKNKDEGAVDLFIQQPSVMIRVAITDFIRRAFDEKAASDLILPLRSYAAIVSILEVRHRKRPEVLDSPKVPLLLQNLLLTIYHGLHKRVAKCAESEEFKDNALVRLVFELVKSDDPRNEFHSLVKKVIQLMNKKGSSSYVHEFLRRSVIIEDIVLNPTNSNSALIDWDEVFDKQNLIKRFDIDTSDFHKLEKFKTVKLPKKFISLYLPPFNVDICDYSYEKVLDLITGQVVSVEKIATDDRNNCKFIDDYERDVYKGGLAMYLVLTKSNASSIMFHSQALGKSWMNDSFYVDQFGDTDHGFNRGLITKLSKDNLSNALDKFMSGEVTLY